MQTPLDQFRERLRHAWLPAFCNDPHRDFSVHGFVQESIKLSDFDAANFMRALDANALVTTTGGRYRCARSSAFEQIFWEGPRSGDPRRLTLWIEPVITLATIGRLHLDFGWPADQLGMQSRTWAFDFVVFRDTTTDAEYVAGEVKKSVREIDAMLDYMRAHAAGGLLVAPDPAPQRNAFRKWRALSTRRIPYFWAVGPDNYTRLFAMHYLDDRHGEFQEVGLQAIHSPH